MFHGQAMDFNGRFARYNEPRLIAESSKAVLVDLRYLSCLSYVAVPTKDRSLVILRPCHTSVVSCGCML